MLAARRMMISYAAPLPLGLHDTSGVGPLRGWAGNNSIQSAPFTPAANTLLVVGVGLLQNTAGHTDTLSITDTIGGLTWTQIPLTTTQWFAGGQGVWYMGCMFWAFTGASPPNGRITVTASPNTVAYTGEAHLWAIDGADPVSPIGVTGEAYTANGSSPFGLTLTLSGTPDPSSLVLAQLSFQNTLSGVTEDPDYTFLSFDPEVFAGGFSMDWSYKLGGADDTIAWTTIPGNGGAQGLAIEIKSA